MTTLAGVALLGEVPRLEQALGVALISLAVLLVARQRPPGAAAGRAADRLGLLLVFGALLCGVAGALLSRAALLQSPMAPLQAASVRLLAATAALLVLLPGLPRPGRRPRPAMRRWPWRGCRAAWRWPSSSTAPVMAVPLAGLEGDRPGPLGLLAALAALVGVSLVVGWVPWAGSGG